MTLLSSWTSEDKERLRALVSHHLSIGGSVMDACQQFQFETDGKYKASSARLRWFLQLRWTRTHPAREKQVQRKVEQVNSTIPEEDSVSAAPNTYVPQEETVMDRQLVQGEDELSVRLLNAVSHVLGDRRQLKDDIQEHKKTIELSQRKVKDLEEGREELELKLLEKDAEMDRQERLLVDTQYKFYQIQEDYNHLQETRQNEYDRLQEQIAELQSKYEAQATDYANLRRESSSQIERLETTVRNLEARNTQLAAEAESVRKENVALTRRITEFAQQIASALGQIPVDPPAVTPVPIRPTVAKVEGKDKTGRVQA